MSNNFTIKQLENLPLSNRSLKDTHRILKQGVRGKAKQPGEFRISQNWIGVSLRNAIFIPPHEEDVAELMGNLEKFIHNEELQVPVVCLYPLLFPLFILHARVSDNG